MLAMALRELEFFQQKYAVLSELAQVFEAARVVRKTTKKKLASKRNSVTAKSVARKT
jgi:hypothetical protein